MTVASSSRTGARPCAPTAILSFVPSNARYEMANLGAIVVDDASGATAGAFLPDCTPKISALAPGWNPAGIIHHVDSIRRRLGTGRTGADAWIRSGAQLGVLAGAMRNQLYGRTAVRPYRTQVWRAASLVEAARELYDELVHPVGTPLSPPVLA